MKLSRILILTLALLVMLSACGSTADTGGATKLSFRQALSYDALKALNGSQITINGYLATSSPVDGSFIFLMNMPFQSCPFCIPNTSQLSNTIEVYPKKGDSFSYTNQAVKVTGTLEVAPEDRPFSDPYGYTFSFKIVDAGFTVLKDDDISAELKLWQKFSATDIITELTRMYDYVNFLCAWNTYFCNPYDDGQGNIYPGYFLYPTDALNFLQPEGAQYNYGYQEGYFDGIIRSIRAVDATAFEDLIKNVESARALAEEALKELLDGNYTGTEQYVEQFQNTDIVYTLNRGAELQSRMNDLYMEFSTWLGGWEL